MKAWILILGMTVSLCTVANAALPPLAQNLVELKAILNDKELTQLLDMAEVIESIERTSNGYRIKTARKIIDVDVVYLPSRRIGPQSYKLVFHLFE